MSTPREPVFLARESYRRRRLRDAARFLPFLAVFVFCIPMLFGPEAGTAMTKVFLFFAWLTLIAVSFALSRRLATDIDVQQGDGPDDGPAG
ncbi:MAG: hypothetical protein AAF771_01935 [Pseudomonadota bacterium]